MEINHIVVQAGGKGTRLGYLTANKPKAMVSINNQPLLFHLFKKFKDKKFVIISDYKSDVLQNYLECFSKEKYLLVKANGNGTCGGVRQALDLLPDKEPFLLIWSDLILSDEFLLPEKIDNYIGISGTFSCRWSYTDGVFVEQPSNQHGVAGLFIFKDKSVISNVPENGELVRWMQDKIIGFTEIDLNGAQEFGLL